MLIRHARRSLSAGWCCTRQLITRSSSSKTTSTAKKIPSWLETKGRTRSFLFDEDNPVINREAHKLHKIHLAPWNVKLNPELGQVLQDDKVKTWQTNPYLSMLASPIRKCMWSDKVMPRDFLIAIKAAAYNPRTEKPTEEIHESNLASKSEVSLFTRALLHPAFTRTTESFGKKENRGYVVCYKSAILNFEQKGVWRRLDTSVQRNPLLVYQTESFLRQRILQELLILAGKAPGQLIDEKASTSASSEHLAMRALEIGSTFRQLSDSIVEDLRTKRSLSQHTLGKQMAKLKPVAEGTLVPPAALLDFTDEAAENNLFPTGQISTLLPFQYENLEGYDLKHLPTHRIPVYSIPRIFKLDSQKQSDIVVQVKKKGQQQESDGSWAYLQMKYPEIYERESKTCQDQFIEVKETLKAITLRNKGKNELQGSIIAVPSMSARSLPLLKALWRYRMWVGEGWSGNGFGVLEATGRAPLDRSS